MYTDHFDTHTFTITHSSEAHIVVIFTCAHRSFHRSFLYTHKRTQLTLLTHTSLNKEAHLYVHSEHFDTHTHA